MKWIRIAALLTEGKQRRAVALGRDFRGVAFTVRKEAITVKAEGGYSEGKRQDLLMGLVISASQTMGTVDPGVHVQKILAKHF